MKVRQLVEEALRTGESIQQAKEAAQKGSGKGEAPAPAPDSKEGDDLGSLQEELRKTADEADAEAEAKAEMDKESTDLEGQRPEPSAADEPVPDPPRPQTDGDPDTGPDQVPTPDPGPAPEDPAVSAGDEPVPDPPAPQTGDGEQPAEVGPDHAHKTADEEAVEKTAERVLEYLLTNAAVQEQLRKVAGPGRGALAAGAGLMGLLGGGLAGHQVAQADDDDKMQAAYMAGVDDLAQALLAEQIAGAQGAAFQAS